MDNENKWEYDYSSEHSQTGETGYPNVGSSGMNTANTAGTYGEAAQAAPQAEPNSGSDGGAVPPPEGPRYQAAQGSSRMISAFVAPFSTIARIVSDCFTRRSDSSGSSPDSSNVSGLFVSDFSLSRHLPSLRI